MSTNKLFGIEVDFEELITYCKEYEIEQMTIRNIVVPNNFYKTKEVNWIRKNVNSNIYRTIKDEMKLSCERNGF